MEKKNKKNRRSPTVWRRILLVVVSVIFGVNVYIWNAGVLGGNSMPMPFGIGSAVVMSGSMEPTLSVNDWVCIRESEEYFVGDVVVYQSGRDLVIHEIIDINDGVVTTKGQANNTADEPIDIQYVKGRMIFAIPYIGIVVNFIKSLPGTIILLTLAIILVELSWKKEKSVKDDEIDEIKAQIRELQKELNQSEKGE